MAQASHLLNGRSKGHSAGASGILEKVTPSPNADHSHLFDYDSLLRLFECPKCGDWIKAPVFQCRKGHVVCSSCRSKCRKTCPSCKQKITDVPNLVMEQMASIIAFPCRFQSYGCAEFVPMPGKTNHEAFCVYRPIVCQFTNGGCDQVLQYHLMENHVRNCPYRSSTRL